MLGVPFFRTGVPLHTNLLGVFGNSQLKGVIDDGEVIVVAEGGIQQIIDDLLGNIGGSGHDGPLAQGLDLEVCIGLIGASGDDGIAVEGIELLDGTAAYGRI